MALILNSTSEKSFKCEERMGKSLILFGLDTKNTTDMSEISWFKLSSQEGDSSSKSLHWQIPYQGRDEIPRPGTFSDGTGKLKSFSITWYSVL